MSPLLEQSAIALVYASGLMSKAQGAAALRKANARYTEPPTPSSGRPSSGGPRAMLSSAMERTAWLYGLPKD